MTRHHTDPRRVALAQESGFGELLNYRVDEASRSNGVDRRSIRSQRTLGRIVETSVDNLCVLRDVEVKCVEYFAHQSPHGLTFERTRSCPPKMPFSASCWRYDELRHPSLLRVVHLAETGSGEEPGNVTIQKLPHFGNAQLAGDKSVFVKTLPKPMKEPLSRER